MNLRMFRGSRGLSRANLLPQRFFSNNALEQLKFIPEFEAGLREQNQTDWKKSIVNFHRVRDILVNSMGPHSDLTAVTDLRFLCLAFFRHTSGV
jgi:hypothetical protein